MILKKLFEKITPHHHHHDHNRHNHHRKIDSDHHSDSSQYHSTKSRFTIDYHVCENNSQNSKNDESAPISYENKENGKKT